MASFGVSIERSNNASPLIVGESLTLTANASAPTQTGDFQWFFSTTNSSFSSQFPPNVSVTGNSLSISDIQLFNAGYYKVRATNPATGQTATATAQVSVSPLSQQVQSLSQKSTASVILSSITLASVIVTVILNSVILARHLYTIKKHGWEIK